MRSITISNKGKRQVNQDFILTQSINPDSYLYLVADGMGGYESGGMAAKIVAESILTYLRTVQYVDNQELQRGVNKATLAIRQQQIDKMGATIGGVILDSDNVIAFWAGDVKVMHYKNNRLLFESTSHTLMDEMINNGSITDTERLLKYKHVVTRSVTGDIKRNQIDYVAINGLDSDDLLVICSDGVHNIYDARQIQQFLNTSDSMEEAFRRIDNKLKEEADDNYSVIVLHL